MLAFSDQPTNTHPVAVSIMGRESNDEFFPKLLKCDFPEFLFGWIL